MEDSSINGIPKPLKVERYKASYPPGTRIKLLHMDDSHAPISYPILATMRPVMPRFSPASLTVRQSMRISPDSF
ncbi:MAG: DUF4314 domain-containing protein [Eubacteriales bacterium]|nr:DUF4314 domain-containing protein [Eubacteriales bacterium]